MIRGGGEEKEKEKGERRSNIRSYRGGRGAIRGKDKRSLLRRKKHARERTRG